MLREMPELRVEVVEQGEALKGNGLACVIDKNISFSTDGLESYCFADWQPVTYDMMVVAGAVECCDKSIARPRYGWGREFRVSVPVHDPDRWSAPPVWNSLRTTLEFLTGDRWLFEFRARKASIPSPRQSRLQLPSNASAVMPYSDGLDSRAVADIIGREIGQGLNSRATGIGAGRGWGFREAAIRAVLLGSSW